MDEKTSQQKKDHRTLFIILIWVGVFLIIFASFALFNEDPSKNVKQIELKWNQLQFGEVVEANFIWEDITVNTGDDLTGVIGVSPAVEAPLFSKFSIGGIRKYIPTDDSGALLSDQVSVGIQFFDDSDETRTVLSIVSSVDDLTLQFPKSEYNHNLRNLDEIWTIVGENRCKLFKIYADGMVSQYSYAVFEKDGHFWHIEFTNMIDDEIAQIIYYAMR